MKAPAQLQAIIYIMYAISQEEFEEVVDKSIGSLPKTYVDKVQNVAFIVQDFPSPEQMVKTNQKPGQILLGLYEGVPLTQRQGGLKLLPDIITIFKKPLEFVSTSKEDLYERIHNTVWHEIAHYFGLNHIRIHELERKKRK